MKIKTQPKLQIKTSTLLSTILSIVLPLYGGALFAADPSGIESPDISSGHLVQHKKSVSPNILFVVMDDVGIDQMRVFGYGGVTPPNTPNIDQLAKNGVRFHNTWAMPACTTSRGVFFDGRMPVRTNVYGALGPSDLANSQVSPYEMTAPKLLARKGYKSALFGKFHLGLQANNAAGLAMPRALGWNFFAGWLDETGDPSSIDTSAGGVAPTGTWSCGFVPDAAHGGADFGACYMADGSCSDRSKSGSAAPGRLCRDEGGIFDPAQSCKLPAPDYIDFTILSGHYVSPLVINHENGDIESVPPTDPRARHFRAQGVVDDAVEWIRQRHAKAPWMATVSFASAHTPVMQPPANGQQSDSVVENLNCSELGPQRVITNKMIESLDNELGRLLVETGLASRTTDGTLTYDPDQTDTMVIIVGDNGTLGTTVKNPFDAGRAKGTAYQTGVWVPLIIAGPLVNNPDRVVSSMVNVADLFELFGEIAGIDVHKTVPRPIDSASMLPYLRNPNQPSIRTTNFTQVGPNLQVDNGVNGPCVIQNTCTQIPVSKSVCEDNNGVWWGAQADAPQTAGIPAGGLPRCCNVKAFQISQNMTPFENIAPDSSVAIRNEHYKIVQNTTWEYNTQDDPCKLISTTEFYQIDEAIPFPTLDTDGSQIDTTNLPPGSKEKASYDSLMAELETMLSLTPDCPGDGTIDAVVNGEDLAGWLDYSLTWGLSSVFDFNLDGYTDSTDRSVIVEHSNTRCSSTANSKTRQDGRLPPPFIR